ncbi:MAG: YlzJ-like family protein [Negativicutes bacterium]|nr:YlzJ-like family protein [Negativicutes bacterium]
MLLWTVMPIELVLDGADKLTAYQEIDYAGLRVLVENLGGEQCRIVRLVSTEPQDFLRPEVQPGTVLTYRAVLS